MKQPSLIYAVALAACAVGISLPPSARAAVSDEDFNALKNAVQELNEKVKKLEQVHEQDQQTHQQDQQKAQQLQQQLDQTQQLATNAVQKAEAATQVQPVHPLPPGPPATHQFQVAGDAEVLFGHMPNQHNAFAFADFAPIFLFRANDNILFEAGFDFTMANNAPASGSCAWACRSKSWGWNSTRATCCTAMKTACCASPPPRWRTSLRRWTASARASAA